MTKINKLKKQLQELQNSTVKEKNNNGIFNNVNKVESSARKCTKPIILLIYRKLRLMDGARKLQTFV